MLFLALFALLGADAGTLPATPAAGYRVSMSATPATTALTTFGWSSLDLAVWAEGGRLRRRLGGLLGAATLTYTDLCAAYGRSFAVVGSAGVVERCDATSAMLWPAPPLFAGADDEWAKSAAGVACAESPTGLCDVYTHTVDNVLWETTWTARYVAGSARPLSCKVVGLFGASATANVTAWDPHPQLFELPASCDLSDGGDDNESSTAAVDDEAIYFDDTSGDDPDRPPRLPCTAHVKFVTEVGDIRYTQEKWTTLGAVLSTETVSGVPLTDDTTTTRLVRRDLNKTFTVTSTSGACSVKSGWGALDDGKVGMFDIDSLSWTRAVVAAPCSYNPEGGACDLYTGTAGTTKLKLWYSGDRMLAGKGSYNVLFVTIDVPVTVISWESGAMISSSKFAVPNACGDENATWPSFPDPPGDLVLECLGMCDDPFPSHFDDEDEVESSAYSSAAGQQHENNSPSSEGSSSFDAIDGASRLSSVRTSILSTFLLFFC